jgi:pilus assembly protein CpaC
LPPPLPPAKLPSPPPAALPPAPPPVVTPPAGATPVTTPDVQKEYDQYVKSIVDPQTTLDLVVGRARLMVLASAPQRVLVGDERIAVTEEVSPTELSLKAKAVGTTVLNLWFADPLDESKHKVLSFLVRVYPDPQTKERLRDEYRVLADEINRVFPQSQVSLTTVGDKLSVSGQAKDVAEAAQILRIVRAHAAGESSAASDPMPAEGTPDNPAPVAQQLMQVAGPNVVNLLRVPGEQQVMLRVTVAEVDRAAARSIGLNCSVERHDGTTIFSTRTGELAGLTSMDGTNVPVFLDNGQVGLAIHALRNLNMAKSIAEPHLAALNGHCAEFTTGGRFPVPCASGTDFVPYGVRLNFTPLITDRDCIRLIVQAEVSTKDVASTVPVGCTPVPGLNSRTFRTTVELREGQTMAVAGLIQNNCGSATHGPPWLCELPLLGRLFGSEITATSEQELIVLITPELVHPLECKDAPPLPGCDFIQPSDLEFYLMGHVQGLGTAHVDPAQLKRVNHCEDLFIAGPQGFSNGHP